MEFYGPGNVMFEAIKRQIHRQREAARQARRDAREARARKLEDQIRSHPLFSVAYQTIHEVAYWYGIGNYSVSFQNRKDSYYRKMGHTHVIVFGYQALETEAKGYEEYEGLHDLVPSPPPVGPAAARWAALHEAAHMIVAERGMRIPGHSHGQIFRGVFEELIRVFIRNEES